MNDVARVVLAMQAPEVAEEVLHLLDRSGSARVVATADDPEQLAAAVAQLEPDAVVAEPQLAPVGRSGVPLLALAPRESVSALRAAVGAGASAFFVWPAERDELLAAVDRVRVTRSQVFERRATVVAVHGARGGAGCTFVATHLAQGFGVRGASCVLVDLDRDYADVSQALGAEGDDVRTIGDLVPVADELGSEHLDEVLWHGAVLAPRTAEAGLVGDELLHRVVDVAASRADVVVLHLPRALAPITRWAVRHADVLLQVVSLDVMGFRATTRAVDLLGVQVPRIVVNRSSRAEVTPGDVRRVFGADPVATIPHDTGAARAQDHGRLLSRRGRTGRAFDRLAVTLLAPGEQAA